MAFRLDPTALSGPKLRAGAEKALEEAIAGLTDRPQGLHTAVHEARKGLKRLRALYRLVARDDKDFFARENARLRDAARLLAEGREAAALVETAGWLAGQARSPEETALLSRTVKALEARRDAVTEADAEARIGEAVEALRAAAEETAGLSLPAGRRQAARLIGRGWRRALRRGRRVLSPLTVEASPEDFHELRKSAQTVNAYHTLLRPLWPQAMTARQEQLGVLVDALGRENDLAGLVGLMEREPQHFGEPIEQVVLQRIVARQRQALRLSALQQAAKIFAADPGDDALRIEILWRELAD